MKHKNEIIGALVLMLMLCVLFFFVGARGVAKDVSEAVPVVEEEPEETPAPEPVEIIIKHEYEHIPLPVDYEPLPDCVNVDETDAVQPETVLAEVPLTDEPEEDAESYIVECGMSEDMQMTLHSVCEEFGVDYVLALSVISVESNFQNVIGDGGNAYGYMQIQQRFHRARMERLGVTDLMDAESNFRVGCDLLAELIGKYGTVGGLTAYNTGHSGTSSYATKVLARYAEYSGGEVLVP